MRLRTCIILASAVGAAGSLILAADMYRRLSAAEQGLGVAAANANLVFGMTHVLGTAAMAILFLAICLLLANDREPARKTGFIERKTEMMPRVVSAASHPAVVTPPAPVLASGETAKPKESPSGISEAVPAIIAPLRPPTRVTRPEGPIPSPPPKTTSVIMAMPKFPPAPEVPEAPPVPEHRPAKNIFVVQAPPAPPPSKEADSGDPQPVSPTEYHRAVIERKVLEEQGEIPTATPISGLHEGVEEPPPKNDSKNAPA
jgi:hypothetical protein